MDVPTMPPLGAHLAPPGQAYTDSQGRRDAERTGEEAHAVAEILGMTAKLLGHMSLRKAVRR